MTDDERLRRKEEENFVINMLGEKIRILSTEKSY
jgi:hypothetical protein